MYFASPYIQIIVICFTPISRLTKISPKWKLNIQHNDAIIEHLPGEVTHVPADLFRRLVSKAPVTALNLIVILQCTDAQRILIKESPECFHANYGVDRTILHLTRCYLVEKSAKNSPHLRHVVSRLRIELHYMLEDVAGATKS